MVIEARERSRKKEWQKRIKEHFGEKGKELKVFRWDEMRWDMIRVWWEWYISVKPETMKTAFETKNTEFQWAGRNRFWSAQLVKVPTMSSISIHTTHPNKL